ncbi:hypothetical protein AK812_SmicGene30970 [Symbiodinium microadriaticum]|uniref:Uncharacterized protein n=1 Tax=Symbiodinium microadriaticum TaxID=2951 RepID=A0A1Q9CXX4_SYMMI|nr:hypothetical protein AK812_SmicGene30970 [Symbiodinium microadriaticum]
METNRLEEPMEQGEELDIWNAFKKAAPTDTTGPSADALDKDKAAKFRKPDGKGDSKTHGGGGRGGDGQRSKGNGQPAQRGRHQQGWSGHWGNQAWRTDDQSEIAALKALLTQLARLCLRHEDAVNLWRAECSFVMFIKTGIPGSLVPALFAAKTEWVKLKEASPEKVKRPMRCILFSCLLREVHDRLVQLRDDTQRRQAMEKLGWLKDGHFQKLRWDAKLRKQVPDEERTTLKYEDAIEVTQAMMTRCNTVEALLRFHPTRPITDDMPVGTVAFLLQFSLQNGDGAQLYADMSQLCHCASMMLAGIEVCKVGRTYNVQLYQAGISDVG